MEVLRRGGERAESNGRRNESGEKEAGMDAKERLPNRLFPSQQGCLLRARVLRVSSIRNSCLDRVNEAQSS